MSVDLNLNCYSILGIGHDATEKQIKKSYYKLSFEYHPDRGGEEEAFTLINKAYITLTENREEYDRKSKFGKNYSEFEEFFKIDMDFNFVGEKEKLDKFKSREILDIIIKVDDNFDGTLEYPRYVLCKTCKGSGKDLKSKIIIRDENGNVKGTFDADDGCDFCDGTGKDYNGGPCRFCQGQGKVGIKQCVSCKGERRLLGKQKLSGIKLEGEETIVEAKVEEIGDTVEEQEAQRNEVEQEVKAEEAAEKAVEQGLPEEVKADSVEEAPAEVEAEASAVEAEDVEEVKEEK